ncbi:MAG: hypothetical protein EOM20_21495, partial [Spartobacteria bacterium]|nr:hypothetical protein [Spartobacteria bacterium]
MKRTFPYLNRLWRWAALAVWLPSVASVAAEDIPVSTGVFSVVCTTTHLGSIIDAVAREDIDAHTIIPFGMCPGHFDLTPGEAQALREADLLLYHGFERFLKGMELGSRAVAVGKQVGGNWMIPSIHMQAVYCVADILSAQRPELAGRMNERAARYVEAVDEAVDVVQARMAPYAGVPVICA